MKKFIFISFLVFSVVAGYSQLDYGVKGGLNLATFTGNDVLSATIHPSFHIGGFLNFLVSDKIAIQPELLFSGKGTKYPDGTYRLGYIEVPVLVQYNTQSGFFFEAGPQVGFLLSAKRKTTASVDIKNEMKSTDFSWVAGLGYKSASGFGGGARYDFGFYNVANAGIIRNKTIMISLFYTFHRAEE